MKFIGRLASVAIAIAVSSYGVRGSVDDGCPDNCKEGNSNTCSVGCCAKGTFCEDDRLFGNDNECENTDLDVGCGSCIGTNACKNIDEGLPDSVKKSSIGWNSCKDADEQCRRITSTTIDDESCHLGSGKACLEVSNSVIGYNSCHYEEACREMDGSTIGDNSCRNKEACDHLNGYRVGNRACRGDHACDNCGDPSLTGLVGRRLSSTCVARHLSKSKNEFEKMGGTCKDGTIPTYDIQPDTCVGDKMCNLCDYYLGCLPPGRCNENLSPEDVLLNPEGKAQCKLCYESGKDELNIDFSSWSRRILEGGIVTTVDEDSEGSLFGGDEPNADPTIEHNAVPFSCDQVGTLIATHLTEVFVQDVLDRFDFSMGTIRFELVDAGEDHCRIVIKYPPSALDRPTEKVGAEFRADVRRLFREENMLESLRAKYRRAFALVKEIVISDDKDSSSREVKPKRSKKNKAKKRGKGKKRSKGNKSSKDARNLRAM